MSINVMIMLKGQDDLSIFSVVWLRKNSEFVKWFNYYVYMSCYCVHKLCFHRSILSVDRLKNNLYRRTIVSYSLYAKLLCSFHILTGRMAVLFD